ncbi:hypothetical protein ASF23_17355 [Curtobacterium sp. Leaf261]|nr:hypothetical protein ASF23_17355 [Curtobacterium sp. Leaf261]
MRTVRLHRYGDPSVLQLDNVPRPRPPIGDELLVRVAGSSINGTDLGFRRGKAPIVFAQRLPLIPGFDVSGEVIECGPAVTAFTPGDQVMALLDHGGGGLAEQVLLRQGRAALAPTSIDVVHAAALPLAGLTALQALFGVAGLQHRHSSARVIVLGAAGGIGSYAVQLAHLAGAEVTGVASGPKLPHVTALGAARVIDYTVEDVLASGLQATVVLDTTGGYRFADVQQVLEPGGVMVSTRPVSVDALRSLLPSPTGFAHRFRKRRSEGPIEQDDQPTTRFGFVATRARSQDLAHLANLVDQGLLRVPIVGTFSLDRAAEAHRLAEGSAAGKVIIEVDPAEQ